MNPFLQSSLRAALGLLGGALVLSAAPGFAVLELFTSQGCSSCPSADRLLATLADEAAESGRPVHVLSFHVDDWNRLGWTDPFSRPEFTARQEAYREALSSRMCTPQLVVNGKDEFVGSDGRRARALIRSALEGSAPEPLSLVAKRSGRKLRIDVRLPEAPPGGRMNLALVEKAVSVKVKRGENRGRNLSHANVVRESWTVAMDAVGPATFELKLPDGVAIRGLSLIAYSQGADGTITAAGSASIPD